MLLSGADLGVLALESGWDRGLNFTIHKVPVSRLQGLSPMNPYQLQLDNNCTLNYSGEFLVYYEFTPLLSGDYRIRTDKSTVDEIFYTPIFPVGTSLFIQIDYSHLDAGVTYLFMFYAYGASTFNVWLFYNNLTSSQPSSNGQTTGNPSTSTRSSDTPFLKLYLPSFWLLPAFVTMLQLKTYISKKSRKITN
jgi:hypothetical protein